MTPLLQESQPIAECRWSEPAYRLDPTSDDDDVIEREWVCERNTVPVRVTQADCSDCVFWSREAPASRHARGLRRRSQIEAIRDEFIEMPCMRLTRAQVRRLWHLTSEETERLVGDLIAVGFLAEDSQGRLGRAYH
jgi:hypothetical protein